MSGLQITITTAGYAALVNAKNLGTNPTLVAQIGISDQVFTPDRGMTALPGELKRLATFAGTAVADDTVHVSIRDDGPDTYNMRGFGLYLADGTLFAVYGQAETILEKSAQAMMLLAADIRFADINATDLVFGDTNWINPPATTEVQGVVELATPAETIAGADDRRGVTPTGLKATLDSRFGAGAPSVFIKGLLSLATAALMRVSLGLGSAATRDEGAGKGLDADLLDGQHGAHYRDWDNLTNVPAAFSPTNHHHGWGDIDNVPATAARWPDFTEVTGKPSAYPPLGHVHATADISSGVFEVARIPDLAQAKIKGLPESLDAKVNVAQAPQGFVDPDTIMGTLSHIVLGGGQFGGPGPYCTVWNFGTSGGRDIQLASSFGPTNDFYLRGGYDLTSKFKGWVKLHHSGNQFALGTTATSAKAALGITISNVGGLADELAGKAPLASPPLTGTPTAPTAAAGNNTTQIATTAFVQAAIAGALSNYLPKNNPTFTGTMTGPAFNKSP